MIQIFLAPRSNETSYKNFLSTIEDGVDYTTVEPYLDQQGRDLLAGKRIYAWGNKETSKASWSKMRNGDVILFYKGREEGEHEGKFVYAGRVVYKQRSEELGLSLWPAKSGEEPWNCVFFLDEITPIYIPVSEIGKLAGYRSKFVVQGFMPLNGQGLTAVYEKYGSPLRLIGAHRRSVTPKPQPAPSRAVAERSHKGVRKVTKGGIVEINDLIREEEENLTVFEFEAVMEHLKAVAKQEGLDPENTQHMSKALTLFFLQEYFDDIGTDDLESSITDGANDQGIDAVYIEEQEDGVNMVNIIQTKLCLSPSKFSETRFSGSEADKLMSKFHDIVVNGNFHEHANEMLQSKLNELAGLENKRYRIILLTTALPPARDAAERMISKVNGYNSTASFVELDFVGLKKLVLMLPSLREPKLDFSLRMLGNVVDSHAGKTRIIVGRTQARSIGGLVNSYGDKLFDKNVRVYLKKKNEINKSIYDTATDDEKAKYFFILNNGITIVCDRVEYMHGEASPDIMLKGAQIVNGGQTSNSIFESFRDKNLQDTAEVLVRMIETDDKEIVDMVTAATNSQTPVRDPDLHSNDQIQKVIQQYIKDKYGFYYETKRNEMLGKVPTHKRIDKETATQAYYAYAQAEPATAKTGKSKLFAELYSGIFTDQLNKDELFFSYQLLVAMKQISTADDMKEYPFFRDAMLTSLSLLKRAYKVIDYPGLLEDKESGYKQLRSAYRSILEATRSVIDEEIARQGAEGFEKRRFFIAPKTAGRIEEKLVEAE